jgi:hypothetical protein
MEKYWEKNIKKIRKKIEKVRENKTIKRGRGVKVQNWPHILSKNNA